MSNDSKGLGDEIYSGAASFGKIRAIIGTILGTIIGIALIIGGIAAIKHKRIFTRKTIGKSVNSQNPPQTIPISNCDSTIVKDNNRQYQCHFIVQYTVENKNYTKIFNTNSNTNYSEQTDIVIYYDPTNPENVSLYEDDYKIVGYIFIGLGILLLLSSWIGLWIVYKYKFAAAASGVAGAIDMVRAI